MLSSIARVVAGEYRRHRYLLESPRMSKRERERYEDLCMGEPSASELEGSLSWLSTQLHEYHGQQTVILIDEYDKIPTEGHLHGYRNEATAFLKRWLTGALKGTVDLRLAALTGVQRVSKESIFSDLNNFTVDTTLDPNFSESFGFTQADVEALAAHLEQSDVTDEIRDWYDGYNFGGESVYNPWSVLSYFRNRCVAQPYWTNTSSNEVLKRLVSRSDQAVNDQLTSLAEGGSVEAPLDLGIVFGELESDTTAIWPQLYLAGYVTTDDVGFPNDDALVRSLHVPNQEVRRLFRNELIDRADAAAGGGQALASLHDALKRGNAPALAYELEQALLNTVSYFDLQDENSCHMWLLSLLYGMEGYRFPQSNREVGRDRPDIFLAVDGENEEMLPAIVVETKFLPRATPEELQVVADSALDCQALPKRYAHGVAGTGALYWAVAFDAHKNVAVTCVAEG